MVKTRVDVHPDGSFLVETVNRGEEATGWLAKLRGEDGVELVGAN